MNDCEAHDWPDGRLLTTEGLPRCPHCRVAIPGGVGRRPKRRGRQRHAPPVETFTPYVDPAMRAAADDTLEGL